MATVASLVTGLFSCCNEDGPPYRGRAGLPLPRINRLLPERVRSRFGGTRRRSLVTIGGNGVKPSNLTNVVRLPNSLITGPVSLQRMARSSSISSRPDGVRRTEVALRSDFDSSRATRPLSAR